MTFIYTTFFLLKQFRAVQFIYGVSIKWKIVVLLFIHVGAALVPITAKNWLRFMSRTRKYIIVLFALCFSQSSDFTSVLCHLLISTFPTCSGHTTIVMEIRLVLLDAQKFIRTYILYSDNINMIYFSRLGNETGILYQCWHYTVNIST